MDKLLALVVEDSPAMRQLIIAALERIGITKARQADDGMGALKMLQAEHYDIVFIDINMPVMDGLKLLEMMRKDESYKKTPVIIVTTEAAEADRQKAFALGANGYITKPIKAQEFIDTTRWVVENIIQRA